MKTKLISSIIITASSVFLTIIFVNSLYKMTTAQHDYQLDATPKGYNLYSGSEKIGFIPAGNSTLDSLIINHNQ